MKKHWLPVCMAVWYNSILDDEFVDIEEICEQGYADLRLDGMNGPLARRARRSKRWSDFVTRKTKSPRP